MSTQTGPKNPNPGSNGCAALIVMVIVALCIGAGVLFAANPGVAWALLLFGFLPVVFVFWIGGKIVGRKH